MFFLGGLGYLFFFCRCLGYYFCFLVCFFGVFWDVWGCNEHGALEMCFMLKTRFEAS